MLQKIWHPALLSELNVLRHRFGSLLCVWNVLKMESSIAEPWETSPYLSFATTLNWHQQPETNLECPIREECFKSTGNKCKLPKMQMLKNQNHPTLLSMLNVQRHCWGFFALCVNFVNSSDYPTVCQHCRRPPKCLPTLPRWPNLSLRSSN